MKSVSTNKLSTIIILLFSLILLGNTKIHSSPNDINIVDTYGQLSVSGNRIVNQHGDPVALRGMSLYWSQWIGKYYNYDCIKWLRDDWKCTVVRAAMAVESGGYLNNPAVEKAKIEAVADACIDLGIYVIIDWHDHNAHLHQAQAVSFFKQMAEEYGEYPNVLYEIYNEPLQISWPNLVKPYSQAVTDSIRTIDPDNIVLVGSPTWSQDVDVASLSPLTGSNIAYTLHFYAATHKQSIRNKALTALNNGVALFVSEFGTCEASGSGAINATELNLWYKLMDDNIISWCNWSIADINETSAALLPGASATGNWPTNKISQSGTIIRSRLNSLNGPIFSPIEDQNQAVLRPSSIHQFPNPVQSTAQFQFQLLTPQIVRLEIYNLLGQKVTTLLNSPFQLGTYTLAFDLNNLPSGTYFYCFQTAESVEMKRLQIVR